MWDHYCEIECFIVQIENFYNKFKTLKINVKSEWKKKQCFKFTKKIHFKNYRKKNLVNYYVNIYLWLVDDTTEALFLELLMLLGWDKEFRLLFLVIAGGMVRSSTSGSKWRLTNTPSLSCSFNVCDWCMTFLLLLSMKRFSSTFFRILI